MVRRGILNGQITNWNNSRISADNGGVRLQVGLPAAILQNRSGRYVAPTAAATSAALAIASDLNSSPNIITVTLPNPSQATAYPIVGVSYLLFFGIYGNPNISGGIKGSINWALAANSPAGTTNPNTIATNLGYAPLPASLKSSVTLVSISQVA